MLGDPTLPGHQGSSSNSRSTDMLTEQHHLEGELDPQELLPPGNDMTRGGITSLDKGRNKESTALLPEKLTLDTAPG